MLVAWPIFNYSILGFSNCPKVLCFQRDGSQPSLLLDTEKLYQNSMKIGDKSDVSETSEYTEDENR